MKREAMVNIKVGGFRLDHVVPLRAYISAQNGGSSFVQLGNEEDLRTKDGLHKKRRDQEPNGDLTSIARSRPHGSHVVSSKTNRNKREKPFDVHITTEKNILFGVWNAKSSAGQSSGLMKHLQIYCRCL